MSIATWLEKANRSLTSAKLNLDDGDPDGACNRAYYAMFHAARAALVQAGQDTLASAKTHSGLIGAFGAHLVKTGKLDALHGRAFSEVSRRRLVGDYEGDGVSEEHAKAAVESAENFVVAVEDWIKGQA